MKFKKLFASILLLVMLSPIVFADIGETIFGLQNVSDDLSPELGGNLNGNGFNITNVGTLEASVITVTDGDVTIENTPTPSLNYIDTDTIDGDISSKINSNCTDITSANEDCDLDFSTQEAGVLSSKMTIDADNGILIKDDLKIQNNVGVWLDDGRTSGLSVLGTPNSRFGISFAQDQGSYITAGGVDGFGNNCLNIESGNQYPKNADCDTQQPYFITRFMADFDYDIDNQRFISIGHNATDGRIATGSGNIVLDPFGSQLVVDGFVNDGFSVQSLTTGQTLQANAGTIYVEGSGGAVINTATPSISAGLFNGQRIRIIGDSANAYTLQDESSLAGSTLELNSGLNRQLVEFQILVMEWSSRKNKWLEVSYSPN